MVVLPSKIHNVCQRIIGDVIGDVGNNVIGDGGNKKADQPDRLVVAIRFSDRLRAMLVHTTDVFLHVLMVCAIHTFYNSKYTVCNVRNQLCRVVPECIYRGFPIMSFSVATTGKPVSSSRRIIGITLNCGAACPGAMVALCMPTA